MAKGSYEIGDATEFVRSLGKGEVAGIATSPPYNKAFKGRINPDQALWANSKLMRDSYADYDDDIPESEYIAWQRSFLAAAVAAVGDNGVVLYNIGRQFRDLGEDRRERIMDGFTIRQTIIWERTGRFIFGAKRTPYLPPVYEMIYLLAGRDWRFPVQYREEFIRWGDVWRIEPDKSRKNPHPAPFPLTMAIRMAKIIDGPLADPFAGSGTMGIAALMLGLPYILNDITPAYRDIFLDRSKRMREQRDLFRLADPIKQAALSLSD